MKVLQATAWYPPHHLGGTEVYLQQLIAALRKHGIESVVCKPNHEENAGRYTHEGVEIWQYPVNAQASRPEFVRGKPHRHFEAFVALLSRFDGAIYHQHSWTRGLGLHHLRAARNAGLKIVLTVHVPANVCLRGTMMLFGKTPCDGPTDDIRCTSCYLQNRGLKQSALRYLLARMPVDFSNMLRWLPAPVGGALGARAAVRQHMADIAQMAALSDRVVVVSRWLRNALRKAGVPAEKILLCRHGIAPDWAQAAAQAQKKRIFRRQSRDQLEILYLGRWDAVKGIDTLVKAVLMLPPDVPVRLTIHAPAPTSQGEARLKAAVMQMAKNDARIRMLPPLPRSALWERMDAFDVLAVPSRCLETGPLVVLEGLARGLFILGSNLGGIAEWVEPETGMLLPPDDVRAWADALAACWEKVHKGISLRRAPRPLRTMDDVGREMADLYRELAHG